MRSYKSKGMREPYVIMLDLVSEGMTIASQDSPLHIGPTALPAYFANRHWYVRLMPDDSWTIAGTELHNDCERWLSKGVIR